MCGGGGGPIYSYSTKKTNLGLDIILIERFCSVDNGPNKLVKEHVKDELIKKFRIWGYPYVRNISEADIDVSKLKLDKNSRCYIPAMKLIEDRKNCLIKKEKEDALALIRIWHVQCHTPKKQNYLGLLPLDIINYVYIHLIISYGLKYEKDNFKNLFDNDYAKVKLPLFFPQLNTPRLGQSTLINIKDIQKNKLNGLFNFVLMADENLIIGEQKNEMGGSHIDLAKGYPVLSAGQVQFQKGKLISYNLRADHYQCEESAKEYTELAFKKAGFSAKNKFIKPSMSSKYKLNA
jgi:hypothetical protein